MREPTPKELLAMVWVLLIFATVVTVFNKKHRVQIKLPDVLQEVRLDD